MAQGPGSSVDRDRRGRRRMRYSGFQRDGVLVLVELMPDQGADLAIQFRGLGLGYGIHDKRVGCRRRELMV